MANQLNGKKIAILVEQGFEQIEMTDPRNAVEAAGALTHLISPRSGQVKGWNHSYWGNSFQVDVILDHAKPEDYDALILPGGVMNPDKLRMNPQAVHFVRAFFDAGKPVGAICHAPWMLIEAGVVKDRTLTSYPSLKTDLINAGAIWVDEEVVTDNGLVTSRNPNDLPAFSRKIVEEFAEGLHKGQRQRS